MIQILSISPCFNNYETLLKSLEKHLNKGAKIILEVDKKTKTIEIYQIIKEKTYGLKKVIIYEY